MKLITIIILQIETIIISSKRAARLLREERRRHRRHRGGGRTRGRTRDRNPSGGSDTPFLLAILRFILAMLFHRRLAFLHLGFRSRRLALFRPGVGLALQDCRW